MDRISHSCEFVEILTKIQCICSKSYIMAVHKGSPPVTPSYWKSDWTNHWTVHLPSIGYWWSPKHWHASPLYKLSLWDFRSIFLARMQDNYQPWHWPLVKYFLQSNGMDPFFRGHHFASVEPSPLALGSLTARPGFNELQLKSFPKSSAKGRAQKKQD